MVYPFLIGVHPAEGYTLVVAPRILISAGLPALLMDAARGGMTDPDVLIHREICLEGAPQFALVYRTDRATERFLGQREQEVLRDNHSRPFRVTYGALLTEDSDEPSRMTDGDLDELVQACYPEYIKQWNSPKLLPPMPSSPIYLSHTGKTLTVEEYPEPYAVPPSLLAGMRAAVESALTARAGGDTSGNGPSEPRLKDRKGHERDYGEYGEAEARESESLNSGAALALILALLALIGVISLLRKRDDRDKE